MRLRFLKPVNGWSGFLTELAIVVLGVLIALAAQQTVDKWRWRSDVADFRAAIDNELGYDLGSIRDRIKQSACINRRLDQLDQWHRRLQSGARLQLTSPIRRPGTIALRTSVWESRTSDVSSHLGLKPRLAYAALYDRLNNYDDVRFYERQVWNEMLDFEGAGELDGRDLLRLRGLIERGRVFSRLIEVNGRDFDREATAIGIRAWVDPLAPARDNVCRPLTWEAA